jgi:hypothetical protein
MSSLQCALTIGALAEQAGCNVPTVRRCEVMDLLPEAVRRASAHGTSDLQAIDLRTPMIAADPAAARSC